MATLRDLGVVAPAGPTTLRDLGVAANPPTDVRQLTDQDIAASQGQLRRGFTSGRLGGQANVLRAQQAGLRAQGLEDEAAALEGRVGAIQGRAATFAPVEQDVTALGLNPGRIVDWGLGAMGSAGASMLDPIALAAGANVAGNAVSMIPHPAARLAGGALRLGGAAGAFGLNAEQMKGEFVNDAYADPALMQRTTPQALNTAANFTGAAGGLVDTLFPVAAAGRIAGRPGLKALAGTGAAGRIGLDMAGEGVTETAQGELKRGALGILNPERDASGDMSARINEFAAGAVGSAPISGVSQLAAKGYERLGVKDDTSSDDVSGKAKPKARENLTERLVRGAKEHADDDAAEAWNATLQGVGSGDIDADTTMRHEALLKELGGRAEKGDATAKQHLDVLSAMDPADAGTWYDDAPRDEAFKHILGDGKDHAKVVEAYRGRRKNQQGAKGDARTQLASSIMIDELGDADGDVKGAASDLARQLASFSKREKAKFADNLAVMEFAAKAVQLYGGKQAQAVVAKVATALGVEQTPLMKQLQQNLAGAADIAAWRSGQRKSRTAAAAELVAMVPPETTLKLRKLGLDLTTASGQLSLLDRVQDFANAGGRTRSEFASTFGPEVADKMIAAVAPGKVIERESAGEKKASGGEKTEVATESDEVSAEAAEDGDDWELAGALKNIDKAPGTKLYLAKGRGAVSSTEGSPFVPDRKTKNLPTLSSVDDTDDGAGEPGSGPKTLDAMIAKAWTALGGQEFNDPVVKVERSGGVTRRTTTVPDPMAAVPSAPGKPGAPQTFGVGSYRIRAASAREVMDAHGLSANKRVELLKAYLARPGKKGAPPLLGEGDPTIQQLATLDRKIKISERETPAKTYAAVGKDGGSVLLDNPAYTELQDLKGQRKEVMAKLAARIGVEVGEDATVPELADAYFDSRFLVTAEQMAEKDQLRLDVAEVRAMIRRGNDDLDFTDQFGDEKMDVQASMNLLRFKSKSAVSKDGIAVIRANDLVSWVRDNRNDKAPRKVNSPERVALAFRNDLMEGIGALAADGHLGELPYMLNEQGKKESFAEGFPPTLRLSGLTQGALDVRKAERVAKVKPFVGPPDVNAVAREQTAELEVRNTDAEELLDQGKEAPRVFQKPKWPARPEEQLTPEQTARYWDAPRAETADELRRRSLGPRDKEGKPVRVPKYPVAPETVETRTDENRVPSELEPVEQRSGVPTERTDIAMRTAVANSALDKIETLTVANAPAKSKRMAEKLWAGLGRSSPVSDVKANPAAGWQAVLDVFATMRSGKLHYAAPLARLLTPANVQRLVDTAKDPAKAKVMLRGLVGEVAAALAKMPDSQFSRAEKTVLTRLLTGNETLVASKVSGALTAMVPKAEKEKPKAAAPVKKAEPTASADTSYDLFGPTPNGRRALKTASMSDLLMARGKAVDHLKYDEDGVEFAEGRTDAEVIAVARKEVPSDDTESLAALKAIDAIDREIERRRSEMGTTATTRKNQHIYEVIAAAPAKTEPATGITVTTHPSAGYAPRTRHNADSAGMTVAIANDFSTAGERLTASSSAGKYLAIPMDVASAKAGVRLAKAMRALSTTTLNVAGNSLHTLRTMGQPAVNQHIYEVIAAAHALLPITKIVTGGQTGVDIAGAIAAHKLGIPVVVTMPSGFRQRGADGKDYNGTAASVTKQIVDGSVALKVPDTGIRKNEMGGRDNAIRKLLADAADALDMSKRARELMNSLSAADLKTLQNDLTSMPERRSILPARLRGQFRDWLSDYHSEREEMMAPERQVETETKFLEELLDYADQNDALDVTLAAAILGRRKNQQTATRAPSTDAEIADAKAYVAKVLGPKITVLASSTFPDAGEWNNVEQTIRLSTAAGPGILSVAYHEAMHGLWARLIKNSPSAAQALAKVMSSPAILDRLKAELANEPAALAAITTGPHAVEERVAYAYQFWAAGLLDVDKPATTVFAKVRKFLRKVLGMVRESETALDIMTAFHDGKLAEPSAAGRVIDKIMKDSTWNEDVKRKFDKQVQGIHAAIATSNQVLRAEKLSATAQALGLTMFTNPGEGTAGRFKKGYINARRQVTAQYTNYLYDALKGLSPRDMESAAKYLQLKTPLDQIPYAPVREAVKGVRALTKRYWTYATGDAGMKLEYLGDDHYPRVWSLNALVEEGGKDKFVAMLMQPKYAKTLKSATDMVNENLSTPYTTQQIAEQMYQHLIDKNGVDEKGLDAERAYSELIAPFFASQKERSFKWLDDADVEPFLEKDLVGAMSRYLHQGVRAAEYVRRFGEGGKDLKEMLAMKGDTWINPETDKKEDRPEHGAIAGEIVASLKAKGITGKDAEETLARHMEDIRNSVEAHEGSLGRDIKPAFRKLSSGLMAYQNLRLLPLSLFAAFGDTVGIAGRFGDGGGKLAFQAFMQGLRDVYARWKAAASDMPAERQKSTWENLAEMIGAVDSHMFLEQMGKAHTSEFMTDFARKANRALFMANGLTAWDRSMRVSATKAAVLFLQHHASLPDKAHSRRWLAELGLAAKDIPLDAEGKLITDRHVLAATKGIPIDQATAEMERIHYALTRWVEGAVLTPNAGQRPTWASDPHYAVLFHLKQFTYSFQDTILKRAFAEASHGNMTPIGALAAAVPTMIAADMVKGLVVGGGEFPAYMKAWDAGDWIAHGASRAGLAGVGQFGIDAMSDPTSLFGPTVDQATDFIFNPTEIGHNIHNAIPGARMIKDIPELVRVAE